MNVYLNKINKKINMIYINIWKNQLLTDKVVQLLFIKIK